ncbi:hypothetical protein H5410_028813 [Solanum commersonii]|uniref:F-box domain-containing protein n=1 Tax=Solanum commersonii TaxID=4109 RepID=A0A9J5Z369_SOLCO|nr:hypothetical protein H5410_028813 [Solanum commersonii]
MHPSSATLAQHKEKLTTKMQGITLKILKFSNLEQPSSARIVVSIDDLLMEILLRVPIRSLLCFKIVSKHWLSIITHPHFSVLCHPNPNRAIGLFLTCPYSLPAKPQFDYVHFDKKNPPKPPFKNLKFIKDSSGISVLQSCNGLMLCSNSPSSFDPAKSPHYKVICVRDSVSSPQHYQIESTHLKQGHGDYQVIHSLLMLISPKGFIGMDQFIGSVLLET